MEITVTMAVKARLNRVVNLIYSILSLNINVQVNLSFNNKNTDTLVFLS